MTDGISPAFDFLGLTGKTILVCGVANKKSVAWQIAQLLELAGADVIFSVRSESRKEKTAKLLDGRDVFVCDVAKEDEIARLVEEVGASRGKLDGLVHSIAFADYDGEVRPFHKTTKSQFLQATDVSCFSLVSLAGGFAEMFAKDASVVAISISTTRMASENYGFMAPIKAALDSSLAFLTKSFSNFSQVRFNAVGSGLLKTSASAGIPGYVDAYLYAEEVIPRKQALQTAEVANTAAFLLSPRSSGITAQSIVVDAGMSINYFDNDVLRKVNAAD